MYGANVGFEIGKRALLAQQLSLNITGHNIANVNTPGYTRQQVILANNWPLMMPFGNVGTGVDISDIRRVKSHFLNQQMREESQKLGKWNYMSQTWTQIESVFNEPEDTGLSAVMDQFWSTWQDLANNPQSEAARISVREQALLLVNSFHHISKQLTDFRASLDGDVSKMVEQINSMAAQIADLNKSITTAELNGDSANDLRDRRDYIVDQLSQIVDVSVQEKATGATTVYLGSMALVEDNTHVDLIARVEPNGTSLTHDILFKGTGIELSHPGGELEGVLETRDDVITGKQAELDQLASELAKAVNEAHRAGIGSNGSTGINFFSSQTSGAASIELDPSIENDINNIAAGLNGEAGDNSNALNIAALRNALRLDGGHSTFGDYYNSIIGEVGIKSKEAHSLQQNQLALVTQIENSRQSLEGVSLDEEMANMIQYQHAYAAAAKVITAMDSALNTIINGMGVGL